MKLSRRLVLRGLGGAALTLPFLEGLSGRRAAAQDRSETFAIFLRQANGVAAEQNTPIGMEPERFWPRQEGALTADSLNGRALDELTDVREHLLVLGNVNMAGFDYGDGHARGALQCLTARGPTVNGAGGGSEAAGMSIDHLIGEQLNPAGQDSMFLYAGRPGGWLGGPCISYRGRGARRSATHSPYQAYRAVVPDDTGAPALEDIAALRSRSVNDVLRAQFQRLLGDGRLSEADRRRVQTHQAAVRDVELQLSCGAQADLERELEGLGSMHESSSGDDVMSALRLHMDVAALAVSCGITRSVAIQIGSGNDGSTEYTDTRNGQRMENFHYLSHRRLSHGGDGQVISNADVLHAEVDRHFARAFRHLVNRLQDYETPSGSTLLDAGIAVWLNDLGNGPGHSRHNCPFIVAGSAGGQLRQGEYVRITNGDRDDNHARLLNTLGGVVGCTNGSGGPLDDFGDPSLNRSPLTELLA